MHQVLRFGRALHVPPLTLKYYVRRDQNERRFAVVVSTKVSKRATVRNQLRRQLRALLRTHTRALPAHTNFLLILRPRTPLPTWKELAQAVATLCARLARRSPPTT